MKKKSKKSRTAKKKTVKRKKKAVKKLKKKVKKVKKIKKVKKQKKKAKPKKKPAKKKTAKKKVKKSAKAAAHELVFPWRVALEGERLIGVVDDYYQHVSVIALFLKEPLKLGERIHVRGHTTDFTQIVSSIQIEHDQVESAAAGAGVGIKVDRKSHNGNYVYKVL